MFHVGLFFGSFNPVHVGHLIIADFMASHTPMDRVWFVVSPQSPFKKKKTLAPNYDRLVMVEKAIENNPRLSVTNVEFRLPIPSYTVDTLAVLREQHPEYKFSLIMGGDNLASFHKWKNYETILAHHELYIYSRPSYDLGSLQYHDRVTVVEAPMMNISASYIRSLLQQKKPITYLVTREVETYIEYNKLYE